MEGTSAAEWPEFPFCSSRCKLVDLGRWLGEAYRIAPEAEGDSSAADIDESDLP